jgi:hypothetical protein
MNMSKTSEVLQEPHKNEHQPASGGGHKGSCQSRSGGQMGGLEEDEKESALPCSSPVEK